MGSGGGKGGGVPQEFGPLLRTQTKALGTAQSGAEDVTGTFFDPNEAFQTRLSGAPAAADRLTGLEGQFLDAASGTPDMLAAALAGLDAATIEGFTPNILASVENRLRPGIERSKEFATADIFEGAARAGTTRSTGTAETVGRAATGIEAGLQNTLGSIEASLAPLTAQQRERATFAQAFQTPGQTLGFAQGPVARDIQESQFSRGLPLGGGGGGGIPALGGSNLGGDFLSAAAQIGSAYLMQKGQGGGGNTCHIVSACYEYPSCERVVLQDAIYRTPVLRVIYHRLAPVIGPRLGRLARIIRPIFASWLRRLTRG